IPSNANFTFMAIFANWRVLRPRDAYSRLSERWQTAPEFGCELDPSLACNVNDLPDAPLRR
ncbi:hypothetical protein, partial [Sphingomonas sp. CFBP 8765]|uniref:hypothetical protein n=1 Tax=Sphingomonas sp. CFBP 8765 TaxID=2775274 RepID=UPI001A7E7D8A